MPYIGSIELFYTINGVEIDDAGLADQDELQAAGLDQAEIDAAIEFIMNGPVGAVDGGPVVEHVKSYLEEHHPNINTNDMAYEVEEGGDSIIGIESNVNYDGDQGDEYAKIIIPVLVLDNGNNDRYEIAFNPIVFVLIPAPAPVPAAPAPAPAPYAPAAGGKRKSRRRSTRGRRTTRRKTYRSRKGRKGNAGRR